MTTTHLRRSPMATKTRWTAWAASETTAIMLNRYQRSNLAQMEQISGLTSNTFQTLSWTAIAMRPLDSKPSRACLSSRWASTMALSPSMATLPSSKRQAPTWTSTSKARPVSGNHKKTCLLPTSSTPHPLPCLSARPNRPSLTLRLPWQSALPCHQTFQQASSDLTKISTSSRWVDSTPRSTILTAVIRRCQHRTWLARAAWALWAVPQKSPRLKMAGKRKSRRSCVVFGSMVKPVKIAKKSKDVASLTVRTSSRRKRVWAGSIWHQYARTFWTTPRSAHTDKDVSSSTQPLMWEIARPTKRWCKTTLATPLWDFSRTSRVARSSTSTLTLQRPPAWTRSKTSVRVPRTP